MNQCNRGKYTLHLSGLNSDKLREHLLDFFYSHDVMESAKCIANCMLVDTSLSGKDRFREYIVSSVKTLINDEYSVSLNKYRENSDGIFIIKSCQEQCLESDLAREAELGIDYLNNLRRITPFFRYVFDYVDCSPVLNVTSSITICPSEGEGYCILEPLVGINLRDFLMNCNLEKFIKMYVFVLLSLKTTQDIELMLFNCDVDNIVLRQIDREYVFNFDYDENTHHRISLKDIPSLVNYEDAKFRKDDGSISMSSNYEVRNSEEYNDLYDAHTLFVSCYSTLKRHRNVEFMDELIFLLDWFGIKTKGNLRTKYYQMKHRSDERLEYSLSGLIELCFQRYPFLNKVTGILPPPTNRLNREMKELGMEDYGDNLTFIEYYELKKSKPEEADKHFDFEEAYQYEDSMMVRFIDAMQFKIEIEPIIFKKAFSVHYLALYKKRCQAFLVYLNSYHRLRLHSKVGREIIKDFDPSKQIVYDKIDEFLAEHYEWLETMKERVKQIHQSVNDEQRKNEINNDYSTYLRMISLVKTSIDVEESYQ